MRHLSPTLALAVLAAACASSQSSGSQVTEAPATMGIVVNSGATSTTNLSTTNTYTAIATDVSVPPDSAFQVLSRVYATLEIPVAPMATKLAVGNDVLKIRRRIAGLPMQRVLDCGDKMGLPNAETWDIQMNLLSYVQPDGHGGSNVLTRIQAMGSPPDLSNRDLTPCATNGELEKKIGDMVKKLIAGK